MSYIFIKELLPFLYRTAPQVTYVYMQTASIDVRLSRLLYFLL